MPRQRNPPTLQSICLEPLMEMLWDWWLNRKGKLVAGVQDIYPYYRLPRIFTEEILLMLSESHEVYTGHVCLLILLGMKRFNLTKLYYVDFELIMSQPFISLKNLVHLDISRSRLPLELLNKLSKEIPQIQVLRMQFTNCTDKVLASIAFHCSELTELDISFCPITDAGIQKVFNPKVKYFQKLTTLCIIDTKVTTSGAQYILEHTPSLTDLDFNNAIELFVAMHSDALHAGSIEKVRKYNLRLIRFNLEPKSHRMHCRGFNKDHDYRLISQGLHIAIVTCPLLSHVIVNEWNPDETGSLHLLTHCVHLTCLEFNVKDFPTLSMMDVQPVLETRGHQLKTLVLKHILNIDIVVLCAFCSYLEVLHLDDNKYFILDETSVMQFYSLKDLTLIGNIPEANLYQLLIICPSVANLTINHSYNFTQELLQSVLLANPFPSLENLNFSECDRFMIDGLQSFIQCENLLSTISIENCRISYTQYVHLLQWIAKFQPTTDITFEFKSRIW